MEQTTALTNYTPQQAALLDKARKSTARPSVPFIPQIKLLNHGSPKIEGIKKGEFYTEVYDGKEKVCTGIGKNPSLVILHRAYTYSYYDEKSKKLVAWTSDIQGFTDLDIVYLYSKDLNDKATVEKRCGYPEMKKHMKEKYPDMMKFVNVLYVLYDGRVYRMFVKNASVTGLAPGESKPDYKKPQLWSLMHYIDKCSEVRDSAYFENVCKLGSDERDEGMPFFMMTFTHEGEVPEDRLAEIINTYGKLMSDLELLQRMDIERMTVKHEVETMKADELPDL